MVETIAKALFRYRALVWVAGVAAAVFLVRGMFWNGSAQSLLGALSAALWAGFLLAFSYTFARHPPTVEPDTGLRQRLKAQILRKSYAALLAIFAVVALMLVWLTLRVFAV